MNSFETSAVSNSSYRNTENNKKSSKNKLNLNQMLIKTRNTKKIIGIKRIENQIILPFLRNPTILLTFIAC